MSKIIPTHPGWWARERKFGNEADKAKYSPVSLIEVCADGHGDLYYTAGDRGYMCPISANQDGWLYEVLVTPTTAIGHNPDMYEEVYSRIADGSGMTVAEVGVLIAQSLAAGQWLDFLHETGNTLTPLQAAADRLPESGSRTHIRACVARLWAIRDGFARLERARTAPTPTPIGSRET